MFFPQAQFNSPVISGKPPAPPDTCYREEILAKPKPLLLEDQILTFSKSESQNSLLPEAEDRTNNETFTPHSNVKEAYAHENDLHPHLQPVSLSNTMFHIQDQVTTVKAISSNDTWLLLPSTKQIKDECVSTILN